MVRTQKWRDYAIISQTNDNFKLLKVPASAIMTSSVLNIMLSLVTYLAVFILKIIESTRDIGRALNNLFLIFAKLPELAIIYLAPFMVSHEVVFMGSEC